MKNPFLFTLLLFVCLKSYGQADSVPFKKFRNEISVNIAPALVFAFGGLPYNQTWGGMYKRSIKNDLMLRVGGYAAQKKYYIQEADRAYSARKISKQTDSTLTETFEIPWQSTVLLFQIGLEKRFVERKFSSFTGIDLTVGQSAGGVFKVTDHYSWDTIPGTTAQGWQLQYGVFHDSGSYYKRMTMVGLFCFAGMQYKLTSRIGISASIGIYPFFIFGTISTTENQWSEEKIERFSEIDLYLNNVIHDISLTYRF